MALILPRPATPIPCGGKVRIATAWAVNSLKRALPKAARSARRRTDRIREMLRRSSAAADGGRPATATGSISAVNTSRSRTSPSTPAIQRNSSWTARRPGTERAASKSISTPYRQRKRRKPTRNWCTYSGASLDRAPRALACSCRSQSRPRAARVDRVCRSARPGRRPALGAARSAFVPVRGLADRLAEAGIGSRAFGVARTLDAGALETIAARSLNRIRSVGSAFMYSPIGSGPVRRSLRFRSVPRPIRRSGTTIGNGAQPADYAPGRGRAFESAQMEVWPPRMFAACWVPEDSGGGR